MDHLCHFFINVVFNSALPQDKPYCEGQPDPTMFTMTCQFNGTNVLPNWRVTGLATPEDVTIGSSGGTGPFIRQGVFGESTLTVDSQNVRNGSCFQCEFTLADSSVQTSKKGCVTAVGK